MSAIVGWAACASRSQASSDERDPVDDVEGSARVQRSRPPMNPTATSLEPEVRSVRNDIGCGSGGSNAWTRNIASGREIRASNAPRAALLDAFVECVKFIGSKTFARLDLARVNSFPFTQTRRLGRLTRPRRESGAAT